MARTPVGSVPQHQSRTALYAAVAARLDGVPAAKQGPYFRDSLGLAVGKNAAEKAAAPHRTRGPQQSPRGPAGNRRPKQTAALRDWIRIDTAALGLGRAVVTFPGNRRAQRELRAGLERLPGVTHVLELGHQRDLVALVLFADFVRRDALRTQLEELADEFVWDDVVYETEEPARATWRNLARAAARHEGLLLER